ncbi:MAG: thioesterase family protein [Candidatus Dormibacteria bacterium]
MRREPTADDGVRSGPAALAPGATYDQVRTVREEMLATHLGSGTVGVLATPAMVGMMEGASMRCVQPFLEEGQTTVGFIVNIRHLAPTGLGQEVSVRSTVKAVEGKRITFTVECREGDKKIGDGEHVRAIIESSSFLEQTRGGATDGRDGR